MAILHVAITGRDKRHLTALGPKLRVVVVGYREEKHRAVVDAYINADKVKWLERQGYGVKRLEAVDAPDRARHAEERMKAAGKLSSTQWTQLVQASRLAKESLLGERPPQN